METDPKEQNDQSSRKGLTENQVAGHENDHAFDTKIDEDNVVDYPAGYSSSKLPTTNKQAVDSENYVEIDDLMFPSLINIQKLNVNSESTYEVAGTEKKQSTSQNEIVPCSSHEFLKSETIETTCCFGLCRRRKSLKNINTFWLISVPKSDDTLESLNSATEKDSLSQNYKFHIPDLKVGILDTLMSLTEQLSTLDNFVGDVTKEICGYMESEVQGNYSILEENLKIKDLKPATYLTRFSWNISKFPTWHPIPLIADIIFTEADRIQKSLQQKIKTADNLKSNLKKYENRETESLQYRYLGDIVKKEHFVTNSNFLVTLLVVVPNDRIKIWLNSYESFSDMVVPASSQKIFSDATHSLFNVILSKNVIEDFKMKAVEQQFLVRDFQYSEEYLQTEKEYYENLLRFKTRQLAAIFLWAKVHFSECFEAWIHVKALRIHVESVLRFGLPVSYESVLLIPLRSEKKLKKLLNNLYKDIDSRLARGSLDEIPHSLATYEVEEFFPYVFFKIDLSFCVHLKK